MKISDFDNYCRSFLNIEEMKRSDPSMNGVQVGDLNSEIKKMAFAVDASLQTFEKAAQEGADLLFVHHGLFWGQAISISGAHYKRVKCLIENNIALYAAHLPLDMHGQYGNNAGLADILGLVDREAFGAYKGNYIGVKGRVVTPLNRDELVVKLFGGWESSAHLLPFGKKTIETVGLISGGGTHEVSEAIADGLDLYITGDRSHTVYHEAKEAGINVLFGGHYLTETTGVRSVMKKVEEELGLECIFIDVPTGL